MQKAITFRADGDTIDAARERAKREGTTLSEEIRRWLESYARSDERMAKYDGVLAEVPGKMKAGPKLTREEMNEPGCPPTRASAG